MSTTIKSAIFPESRSVTIRNHASDGQVSIVGDLGIIVNHSDLLSALRAEGVLPADDDAATKLGKVRELVGEWEGVRLYAHDAAQHLRDILDPTPALPTGLGAVLEVERKSNTHISPWFLIRTSEGWQCADKPAGAPFLWHEDDLHSQLRVLRVLSEGVTL